jgi:hypothetical protein
LIVVSVLLALLVEVLDKLFRIDEVTDAFLGTVNKSHVIYVINDSWSSSDYSPLITRGSTGREIFVVTHL